MSKVTNTYSVFGDWNGFGVWTESDGWALAIWNGAHWKVEMYNRAGYRYALHHI
jgi:hypothetical protein